MQDLDERAKDLERHPKLNEGRVLACSKLENSGTAGEREHYIRLVAGVAEQRSANR